MSGVSKSLQCLLVVYCLDSDLRFGNSCSTFSFSDSGVHLGHSLPSILLPGVFTILSGNTILLIRISLLFFLLTPDGFVLRHCYLSAEIISTKKIVRHGAEPLVGGVEERHLSFLSPLSPGSSWILGRDPLLVVLYCNSPDFHPN